MQRLGAGKLTSYVESTMDLSHLSELLDLVKVVLDDRRVIMSEEPVELYS